MDAIENENQRGKPAALTIDGPAREVKVDGQLIDLTRLEFDLLWMLHHNQRIVITNEQISRVVLKSDWYSGAHTIAVHINHLRHKLGPTVAACIVTKRGVGYMFDPQVESQVRDAVETGVDLFYNGDLELIAVYPNHLPFFGWIPQEVVGTKLLIVGALEEQQDPNSSVKRLTQLAASGTNHFSADMKIRCADGSYVDGHVTVQLAVSPQGELHEVSVSLFAAE